MAMSALFDTSSKFAMATMMSADTPVSPAPGDGEDAAPPPAMQGARKTKEKAAAASLLPVRLKLDAGGGFILFEAQLTPMKTPDAEEKRKSMFDVLKHAEKEWVIAEKKGGRWGTTPSDYQGPLLQQPKSIFDLADDTYKDLIIRSMEKPILIRYRRAQKR
jgi:hypothetical protein